MQDNGAKLMFVSSLPPGGTLSVPEGLIERPAELCFHTPVGLGQQGFILVNPSGFGWDTEGLNEESR